MQTPAGFEIVDGVVPIDWLAVIFNPSFPYRLLLCRLPLSRPLFVAASAAWHRARPG